jgi:hypothetical protein
MESKKFNKLEKHLFSRMINYFIEQEEKELFELKRPSGNSNFINSVEANIKAFRSIKINVEKVFF